MNKGVPEGTCVLNKKNQNRSFYEYFNRKFSKKSQYKVKRKHKTVFFSVCIALLTDLDGFDFILFLWVYITIELALLCVSVRACFQYVLEQVWPPYFDIDIDIFKTIITPHHTTPHPQYSDFFYLFPFYPYAFQPFWFFYSFFFFFFFTVVVEGVVVVLV